jgi:hypothetical protein
MSIYGQVLFEHESVDNTIKETVEKAVKERADLRSANLRSADLSSANLRSADLSSADLSLANLRSADLSSANLRSADLSSADLSLANLSSADFDEPIYISDLYSLKLLPKDTTLTYWKFLKNGKSPIQDSGKIKYVVGKTYTEKDCNKDEFDECGAGLNVATIQWCLKNTIGNDSVELIECQFKVSDIVAIPYWTDGKFRVKRLKVLRKISRADAVKLMKDITKLS